MIISRYLFREIGKPFAVVLGVLIALFASYSAAEFLSDAVNGLLPTDTIVELIGLKVLIALEVLIPISLYMSVVLSFGRLYGDSEFTAMFALRVTPARVMATAFAVSACLAVVVSVLSLAVRPIAYQRMHEISRRGEATLDINAMQAGTFYVGQQGHRVIFFAHRNGPGSPARDLFVQRWRDDRIEIIHARLAYPLAPGTVAKSPDAYLVDVRMYEIDRKSGQADRAMSAAGMVLHPNVADAAPPEYSSVSATTSRLAKSMSAPDIAEFQWRLSTPLSTLLLGLLGVPLSRVAPRQSKYTKFGTAILVYSGYYLLCTSARTWVQHGAVPAIPGIWWAPALLALGFLIAVYGPRLYPAARKVRLSAPRARPAIIAPDLPLGDHDAA